MAVKNISTKSRTSSNTTSTILDASVDSLMPQKVFLDQHNIGHQDFKATGLSWGELEDIHLDYRHLKQRLEHPARAIVDILFSREARDLGVHSVRYRIKDSNSLIEKIIRKKIKNPNRSIGLKNYSDQITDLIGIRALHVFKNEIVLINQFIVDRFMLKKREKPIHYYRNGDDNEFIQMCRSMSCKQEIHPKGYRSFHYVVSTQLTRDIYHAEIQVRTVFEEGWSEIDHKIRYSYKNQSSSPFDNQLNQLNKLAGLADEASLRIKELEQSQQQRILAPSPKKRRK